MMTGTLNANDGRTRRQRCRAAEGSQGDYMKKCVTLLVAAIALAMSHSVTQAGEGQQSIPLRQLAGGIRLPNKDHSPAASVGHL